jgi:hypothetical protein
VEASILTLHIDELALTRAKRAAGVSREVRIVLESDPTHPIGVCYPSDNANEAHLIFINPELTKIEANFVVCHELKHAAQEEADGRFSAGLYRVELQDAGIDPEQFKMGRPMALSEPLHTAYTQMPSEVEADNFARENCDLYEVFIG